VEAIETLIEESLKSLKKLQEIGIDVAKNPYAFSLMVKINLLETELELWKRGKTCSS